MPGQLSSLLGRLFRRGKKFPTSHDTHTSSKGSATAAPANAASGEGPPSPLHRSDPNLAMSHSSSSGIASPANTSSSGHSTPEPSPRRGGAAAPPFICIPLYIYPNPGAWDPLLRAAAANPDAHFHAIVNPHNGPGESPLPDENYLAVLRELSALENVTVLGYVHVTYGSRRGADVERDIAEYAAWKARDEGRLRIDGVFFDEAPSDPSLAGYMGELTRFAKKELRAVNGGVAGLTMLNPGVVVGREYYNMADYIVAFEQSLGHWGKVKKELMSGISGNALRAKTVVMVHSCRVEEAELRKLARGFKASGIRGQYVTAQIDGGYSEWPSWWEKYVDFVFPAGEGKGSGSDKC